MPAIRIAEFDTWRPGYGLASVRVLKAGTSDLASIYTNEELTIAAANPQTLSERIDNGISYGRWSVPLYIGVPYELEINTVDRTGVQRPALTTLDAQDASKATVKVAGGSKDIELEDHLVRRIDVRDYGDFIAVGQPGASASTNNATLTAALGVAGAAGSGYVELPAGTYQVTAYTVPQGVVIRGQGRVATALQSTQASDVATIGGARAGFSRITLDGVSLVAGSVGVYAANKDEIVFDDVEIKRFETGLDRRGGTRCAWNDLFISNCVTGYKAHGDAASGVGGALQYNHWRGGKVELCTTAGIDLRYVDQNCEHNVFAAIVLDSNTGKAAWLRGVRHHSFFDCRWSGNTNNLTVEDGSPATTSNTVIGLNLVGGAMSGGTVTLSGTLESVALRWMALSSMTVTLTAPSNNILVEDCRETSVTISGDATAWIRHKTTDRGSSSGITTGNAATKVWAITLVPGQKVYLEARVLARQRNGTDRAYYHKSVAAHRPGSTLAYDTQTANFTVGNVLTGATSGATARIIADSDSGTTGTLTLQDISGVFVDNEIITDGATGSAMVNGSLVAQNCALEGGIVITHEQETIVGWDATFAANGPQIELRVTGATGATIEWKADVDVVST